VSTRGFTLIEILLVITIMMVMSAMVAPNFFQATQADVRSEARFMQKVLRVASEEAQLSSRPIRCSVYTDHLRFETPAMDGSWQPLQDDVFQHDLPKPPVEVLRATLDGDIGLSLGDVKGDEIPPLTRFTFWPDGNVSAGQIVLGIAKQPEHRTLQLRPGPAGIRVMQP